MVWMVNVMPRERDLVLSVQEAGWVPGPGWMGVENLTPSELQLPDRPACSESLY